MTDKEKNVMQVFLDYLEQNNLREADAKKVLDSMKQVYLKKGDFFCKAGKRCDQLGILLSGFLVAYYKNDKGEEVASRFYEMPNLVQNIVVSSFESFRNNTPSGEYIKAMEDSYLFVISRSDLERLYQEVPEINRIGRILAEESYIHALKRIHTLQTMKTKDRVTKFENEFKCIMGRGKVQHIASYLGMDRKSYTSISKN